MTTGAVSTFDKFCESLENLTRGYASQIEDLIKLKEDESERTSLAKQANLALGFMSHIRRFLEFGFSIEAVSVHCYKLEKERFVAGKREKVEINIDLDGREIIIRCYDPTKNLYIGVSYYQSVSFVNRAYLFSQDRGMAFIVYCDNRSWLEFGIDFDYKGAYIGA